MEWRIKDSRPIWIQLEEQVTERIVTGVYPMGGKMPSVRELASDAGVNPNTMQRALAQLDAEGLTETNRTTGRNVTSDSSVLNRVKMKLAMEKTKIFLDGMQILGFTEEDVIKMLNRKGQKDE